MTSAPRAVTPAINGWNAEYLDSEYQRFKVDATSVDPSLAAFFRGFELGSDRPLPGAGQSTSNQRLKELIAEAYRTHGHLKSTIDPLGQPRKPVEPLSLPALGISQAELDQADAGAGSARDLIATFESYYCGTIGAEFMHCATPEERRWFIERFENPAPAYSKEMRRRILQQVTLSETFEKWCGKRYQGKKRFSLEGGESLIPMLRFLTDRAGELGVKELILGMAHRGRLNVLRHYLGKDSERILTEFEDSWAEGLEQGGGDVKYHRGYSGDQETPGGIVHLSMLNNPSHLESVNALVMGRARARQDAARDAGRDGLSEAVALLIHGDAALSGQGVISECLNMAYLEGYSVGGTVHLVINNQVGFTTDTSDDRSTEYCTDIAKMINSPVLHVNGDDPEACVRAAMMAMEYRHEFGRDVFVDLVCFRRHGHNEQDEPAYTQPELYALVRAHPGTRAKYAESLVSKGVIAAAEAEAMVEAEIAVLDRAQEATKAAPMRPVPPPGGGHWAGFVGKYDFASPKTSIDPKLLDAVCAAFAKFPEEFHVHPKLKGLVESRANLPRTKKLNHADAEQLAFGSLAAEGIPVRLSGQDSRRGTFTQRHAVFRDERTGEKYTPLNHVSAGQAKIEAWDSPLSEYAVMGFDYGYSRVNPRALVMWEGQFGDFCNTAQVVIDQYMAASEVKWERWAGLVLLLPHGYEGQGPEHSSARLERFLQLCADENMEVVYPSTGAQTFHVLRRQAKRNFRKPLIVLTPKKFLRVETSSTDDLLSGSFQHLIDDARVASAAAQAVTKVVYCSGKIFHELNERREAIGRTDIAIVRVEQLYPFHTELAKKIDSRYPPGAARVWVQEEHRNAGAYLYIADVFREKLGVSLSYVGRAPSASPATGSEYAHKSQQEAILTQAIGAKAESGSTAPALNGSGAKTPERAPAGPPKLKASAKTVR